MSDDLNKILNEAIPRWAKLTGTKLGTNSFTFTIGSNSEFQSWDLQKYVKDLNESRSLDMTGTTAILLLRGDHVPRMLPPAPSNDQEQHCGCDMAGYCSRHWRG